MGCRVPWTHLWASEQVCVVKLVDGDAVIDKLVYTAVNPVQDHLVDRGHHGLDVNRLAALLGPTATCCTPSCSTTPCATCRRRHVVCAS